MQAASDGPVTLVSLSSGGIAHYSYALASALQPAGTRSTVLTFDYPRYDLSDYPHSHRVLTSLTTGRTWPQRITNPLRNLAALLMATRGSSIVHYQWPLGPKSDRLHWSALRRQKKKIVYTAHDVLPHEPDKKSLDHCRWMYQSADAIIVHGERLKNVLADRFSVHGARVHVIPHGNYNFVADTPGRWDRASARASFQFGDDDQVVLFFGMIRPYKGLDDLIEAFRIVQEREAAGKRRLRLLVAGTDVSGYWGRGGYEEQIARAKLGDHVRVHLGYSALTDVPRFFLASDVVAVPYKRGSQSGVLQLAYSFAKPAIATRVGSLDEVVDSNKTARLVAPENPEEFAAALSEILGDPERGHQLGAQGRIYAETELGWGAIADRTRQLYTSMYSRDR
jgi:glycosyltransferase involved in cell wall biosynthesis